LIEIQELNGRDEKPFIASPMGSTVIVTGLCE